MRLHSYYQFARLHSILDDGILSILAVADKGIGRILASIELIVVLNILCILLLHYFWLFILSRILILDLT